MSRIKSLSALANLGVDRDHIAHKQHASHQCSYSTFSNACKEETAAACAGSSIRVCCHQGQLLIFSGAQLRGLVMRWSATPAN